MKSILLDTSAYSNLMRGDVAVFELIAQSETIYFSAIVLGELLTGFLSGSRNHENLKVVKRFLEKPTVKSCQVTEQTAECFAKIKFQLKTEGKPIPMNDLWIAAQAVETGAWLLTSDKHFDHITGLKVINPSIL